MQSKSGFGLWEDPGDKDPGEYAGNEVEVARGHLHDDLLQLANRLRLSPWLVRDALVWDCVRRYTPEQALRAVSGYAGALGEVVSGLCESRREEHERSERERRLGAREHEPAGPGDGGDGPPGGPPAA
jgi:hypothetical protein